MDLQLTHTLENSVLVVAAATTGKTTWIQTMVLTPLPLIVTLMALLLLMKTY